jgi:TetR/AcrR family transcriptional regulator, transcriptional repressor for nem operon
MRYPNDHKDQARRDIVAAASERLRKDGISGTGLRTLMTDAGLTHGAFYAHFQRRSDLVAQAVGFALEQTTEALAARVAKAAPPDRLRALIDSYLRPVHRDRMEIGCAAAALAPEVARGDPSAREAFAAGVKGFVSLLEPLLPRGGSPAKRAGRAYAIFGGLAGALQLARAIPDSDLSDRILVSGREAAMAAATADWIGD